MSPAIADPRRCTGSDRYVEIDQEKRGGGGSYKAECPRCGRWIGFHWASGRFAGHFRSVASGGTESREGETDGA